MSICREIFREVVTRMSRKQHVLYTSTRNRKCQQTHRGLMSCVTYHLSSVAGLCLSHTLIGCHFYVLMLIWLLFGLDEFHMRERHGRPFLPIIVFAIGAAILVLIVTIAVITMLVSELLFRARLNYTRLLLLKCQTVPTLSVDQYVNATCYSYRKYSISPTLAMIIIFLLY